MSIGHGASIGVLGHAPEHVLDSHSDVKSITEAKGDVLVWNSTDTKWDKLPVGTNDQVLTADSTQTLGVKWAASGGSNHNILSATHLDSTAASVVRGDVITGQGASPKWVRLALGTSGQVLRSDGTDTAWATLAHADLGSVTANQHHNQSHDHTASDSSGVLTADEHDSFSEFAEIVAPATPAANKVRLYAKDKAGVSELYYKNDGGTERDLSAGGGTFSGEVDDTTNKRLSFTTNQTAGGATVRWLQAVVTNELAQNVPTGGAHEFRENNVSIARILDDRIILPRSAGLPSSPAENDAWIDTQLRAPFFQLSAIRWAPLAFGRNRSFYIPFGGGSTSTTVAGSVSANVGSIVGVTLDADGPRLAYRTAATSGSDSGHEFSSSANLNLRRSFNPLVVIRFLIPTITSIRGFIGFSSAALATAVGANDPAGSFCGLQFSTPRGDVNWQFMTKDGTTQTLTNSSLAIDTAVHTLWIYLDNTNGRAVFQLDSNAQELITATLPAAATDLGVVRGVETQAAAARDIQLGFMDVVCL